MSPRTRSLLDRVRLSESGGFDQRSIIEYRVFAKRPDAGRNDRAMLGRVKEDVQRCPRRSFEPVWIVKRSAIDAKDLGEALEIEKKLGTAGRAEIDGDPFSAAFRS